ncbi:hypothetical protein BKA65DRAFT_478485 [Rhexocercosporidium sp. MPI-PUGE-AT-0058]|nr:hypothetical protein BKA65DRAFT_478485 [Rhexocercosporidium sp. MPI-PUGE-AT-0058]
MSSNSYVQTHFDRKHTIFSLPADMSPISHDDLPSALRADVKMLLNLITDEIFLPYLHIILIFICFVKFILLCILAIREATKKSRREGEFDLLRNLEGMNEDQVLGVIEHFCRMRNEDLAFSYADDLADHSDEGSDSGSESGYEGGSDNDAEDRDYEGYLSATEGFGDSDIDGDRNFNGESEIKYVDYLNTPD